MSPKRISATITYMSPGAQPPIYLAGSFNDWQPEEMEFKTHDNEHHFEKSVLVEEGGEFQYKFRLGPGDWWVLNEHSPTHTDERGIRNNLLIVPVSKEKPAEVDDHPGESSGSEAILTPSTTGSKEELSTEGSNERTPTPPPIPEVVVEKVDNEPRHGDDFGEDATTSQKEAYEMRAQDAEPDQVIVKPEMSEESVTAAEVADSAAELEIADIEKKNDIAISETSNEQTPDEVASEVADSAAIIDKEDPAPVSSDEEAGRTGERRMSHTPIPEVARTASEVADTAAILDADDFKADMPRFKFVDPDSGSASGTVTPANERAPVFAHEMPIPYEEEAQTSHLRHHEEFSGSFEEEPVIDPNDPSLEPFPEDREAILHTVRSCSSRLDADETLFEGSASSPVVDPNASTADTGFEEPTFALLDPPAQSKEATQPSPVLEMIKEEHTSFDDIVLPGPSAAEADETKSDLEARELPLRTTSVVEALENESNIPLNTKETELPLIDELAKESSLASAPVVMDDALTESAPTEIEPAVTSSYLDPFDSPDKEATSDGESFIRDIRTAGDDGPNIDLPATPSVETLETDQRGNDLGNSTALSDVTNGSNVKMRNAQPVKRPSTPTSIISPHKDKNVKDILAALWQTLFVEWIGGFITRLCGGDRRPLLAVTVLVLTLAPILYMRM